MKKIFLFLLLSFVSKAQHFDAYFEDKTLRLDLIFAGDYQYQNVYLSEIVELDKWHGRKKNLCKTPIQGDAQIRVFDQQDNTMIYLLPFSSLFQEWITLEDAKLNKRSFENSLLIPKPKRKSIVEIVFFDKKGKEEQKMYYHLNPNDILIKKSDNKPSYQYLHKGNVETPIKIAIVAEGYTEAEMPKFIAHSQATVHSLFNHSEFAKYKNHFDIIAVKSVSQQSGVSIPSKNIWKKSAVGSNFDTFYSSRYLTTNQVKDLHRLLENTPYQHIIILTNTDTYGGGGILNAYTLTTTDNPMFAPVVVHEFGHSFAGLGDEYFYHNDVFENKSEERVEPWVQNVTSLVDFESKWKDMVDKNTPIPTPENLKNKVKIGAFEGLEGNGLYIPSYDCRMKTNESQDFCPVCSRAIEKIIKYYTE